MCGAAGSRGEADAPDIRIEGKGAGYGTTVNGKMLPGAASRHSPTNSRSECVSRAPKTPRRLPRAKPAMPQHGRFRASRASVDGDGLSSGADGEGV